MAKKDFIQGAIKRPGGLHRSLGIPQGQTIPKGKIKVAAKKPGLIGQQARLAETLEGSKVQGKKPKAAPAPKKSKNK